MFYEYRVLSTLQQHLRPSYHRGTFYTRNPNRIGMILHGYFKQAIRNRTATVYFFKESRKNNTWSYTYTVRYDPPLKPTKKRTAIIQGFVAVEPVSFFRYCKGKLHRIWSYWIKNNTPADASEIFTDSH